MTTDRAAVNDVMPDDDAQLAAPRVGAVGIAAVRTPAPPIPRRSRWSTMEDYAALVAERTPLRALPMPLIRDDPDTVAVRISQLPSRVGAVFLIGLDSPGAAEVQRRVTAAGGPPVISELDAVTVALAAATLNLLRRRTRTTRPGRAAVIGIEAAPRLGALLAALDVGMTAWHRYSAETGAIGSAREHNDVLIDLAGVTAHQDASVRRLAIPSDPYDFAALAVPGLLHIMSGRAYTPISNDILAACSRALALVTPKSQILPEINERLLVPAIARHVRLAFGDP